MSHSSQVIQVDAAGHVIGGFEKNTNANLAIKRVQQANRVLSHAVTGRLSSSGGTAQLSDFLAVPPFVDVETAAGSLGPTIATLNTSLDNVTDALTAMAVDANLLAVALGITSITYGGGGAAASPIAAIGDSGTAADIQNLASEANPARIAINTNMHTIGALANKVLRALGHETLAIATTPDLQPPPDTYGAGSTGKNPPGSPADPIVKGGGSGLAFGGESPFTTPTPLIDDSMTDGGAATIGVTKAAWDAAITTWKNNIETMATRLAIATNTVIALTDSSTGTAGAAIVALTAFPADSADSGTSLAQKASTDAEMVDMRAAVASLFFKANALAAGLGIPERTYDGGGTVADTLAAVGTVTLAATGVLQTEMELFRVDMNKAFDALAEHVNRIAEVVDVTQIDRIVIKSSFIFDNPVNPVQERSTMESGTKFLTQDLTPVPGSTIPVSGGTAADPGQQGTDVDITFTDIIDNIATIALTVNAIRTALAGPLVKII